VDAVIAGHGFPYRWNPAHQARVGLLPRDGAADDIIWCEVDPCYVFHIANAYDLPDGQVALDVCAFDTMFEGDPEGPNAPSRGLERWTIDPVMHKVAIRTLDPSPQDFPRCDERRFGQPYRYVYSLAAPDTVAEAFQAPKGLYRLDLELGTRTLHSFGPGRYAGEFSFVPAAPSGPEDEGWLIGLVIDAAAETTDLVILDAQDFEGEPVARVHLPHRAPPGFHGNWLPSVG
jgi:carotenoid cleavage dioxygenase